MQHLFRVCIGLITISLYIFTASAQAQVQTQDTAHYDIPYKEVVGKDSLKLDLFLPEHTDQPVPLFTIVHGGAWVAGNKELQSLYYMRTLKERLLKQGIAVASIQYTLVDSTSHFPEPIADCKDAVRWLTANADHYGLDTARFGVWGGSAGGHLALLMANTSDSDFPGAAELASYSCHLKFVVDNFGPTDLNSLFRMDIGPVTTWFYKTFFKKLYRAQRRLTFAMTGYSFDDKAEIKEINRQLSPLELVDSTSVPTLIMHGTKDRIVPLRQSKALSKVLHRYGVAHELVVVPDGNHGFTNIPKEILDELIDKTVRYAASKFK